VVAPLDAVQIISDVRSNLDKSDPESKTLWPLEILVIVRPFPQRDVIPHFSPGLFKFTTNEVKLILALTQWTYTSSKGAVCFRFWCVHLEHSRAEVAADARRPPEADGPSTGNPLQQSRCDKIKPLDCAQDELSGEK
jgi:hypothetical protein